MKPSMHGVAKSSGIAAGSLLTVADLPVTEVAAILAATDRMERMAGAERAQMLAGRRIALLFYESSTRTRTSFELAAKQLGAITTLVSDKSSSIEKGESLKDTGLTLRALGAECIILRHANSGAPYLLAKTTGLPVLNAGDGMHEHPSQALLDLRTMLTRLPGLDPTPLAPRPEAAHPERLVPAPATAAVLATLRTTVAGPGPDRWLAPDLRAAEELVRSGAVVAAAAGAVPGGLW